MITTDSNGDTIIMLGSPDPSTAGAGRIVAWTDAEAIAWIERRLRGAGTAAVGRAGHRLAGRTRHVG